MSVVIAGRSFEIVTVHVLSTEQEDKVREVHVPLSELKDVDDGVTADDLDMVFHFGQNDFTVGPELNTTCSVSMGDVVELDDGSLNIVQTAGFGVITKAQYEHFLTMKRADRYFADITIGDRNSLYVVTDEGVTNRRGS